MAKRKAKVVKKKPRKPKKNRGKGSAFERLICSTLSLWWTNDAQDDVFWRSAMSGGRSTLRARHGKATSTAHGDICAVDPVGAALLRVMTFECKTGYKGVSVHDMVDGCGERNGINQFSKWVQQACGSYVTANSYSWALVVRRWGKVPVIFIGSRLYLRLIRMKSGIDKVNSQIHVVTRVPDIYHKKQRIHMARNVSFTGMPLQSFLSVVKPQQIKEIAKWWREECKKP